MLKGLVVNLGTVLGQNDGVTPHEKLASTPWCCSQDGCKSSIVGAGGRSKAFYGSPDLDDYTASRMQITLAHVQ